MKKLIITALIIFISSATFAQGEYLFRGNSGYEIGVGVTRISQGSSYFRRSSTITATSPFMAYSYQGIFDVGIVHTTQNSNSSQAIGVTGHLFNSYSVPFKLAVTGQVTFLDGEKYYTFSPTFHFDILLNKTSFAKLKMSSAFIDNEENSTYMGFVLFNRTNPVISTFSVGTISNGGNWSLSVGVSFVFPTAKLRNDPSKKEPESTWEVNKSDEDDENKDNKEKKKIKMKKYYGD